MTTRKELETRFVQVVTDGVAEFLDESIGEMRPFMPDFDDWDGIRASGLALVAEEARRQFRTASIVKVIDGWGPDAWSNPDVEAMIVRLANVMAAGVREQRGALRKGLIAMIGAGRRDDGMVH